MRTPEEILNKKGGFYIDDEFSQRCYAETDVIDCMTYYAQQEAEAFAEWCESSYEKVMGNEWQHKYFKEGEMDKIYTTAELYTIFKTEKKDEK